MYYKYPDSNAVPVDNQGNSSIPVAHAYPAESFAPSAPMASFPVSSMPGIAHWPSFNESGARAYLNEHQWPVGLQDAFIRNCNRIPIRFMICDDSGSMSSSDGKKLIGNKLVSCSRWAELTEAFRFHVGLASSSNAPTEIRLLNALSPIRVGMGDADADAFLSRKLFTAFDDSPAGGTPLCKHIKEVIDEIRSMENQLRQAGQKACIVIATDGESSDGDIAEAMRPLKHLPVWVVVRLCTDEDRIVKYWNNIDDQLELEMDVLDDHCGEAEEIHEHNPWLTYGEPMHRIREFGIAIKEIDMLDERKLSCDQLRTAVTTILGGSINDYPHPEVDWAGFVRVIESRNAVTWSPTTKSPQKWIMVKALAAAYGKGGCVVM